MTNAKLLTLSAAALLLAACGETPTAQLGAPPAASYDLGGNYGGSGNATGNETAEDGILIGSGHTVIQNSGGSTTGTDLEVEGPADADSTGTNRGGNTMGSGN